MFQGLCKWKTLKENYIQVKCKASTDTPNMKYYLSDLRPLTLYEETEQNHKITHLKIVIKAWGWGCVLHFKVLEAELHCLPREQFYFINTDTVCRIWIGVEWRFEHCTRLTEYTTTHWNTRYVGSTPGILDCLDSKTAIWWRRKILNREMLQWNIIITLNYKIHKNVHSNYL